MYIIFNRKHPDLAKLAVIFYIKLHKFIIMINLLLGEMRNGLG